MLWPLALCGPTDAIRRLPCTTRGLLHGHPGQLGRQKTNCGRGAKSSANALRALPSRSVSNLMSSLARVFLKSFHGSLTLSIWLGGALPPSTSIGGATCAFSASKASLSHLDQSPLFIGEGAARSLAFAASIVSRAVATFRSRGASALCKARSLSLGGLRRVTWC